MSKLNRKGPEEKGQRTGRKLGKCKNKEVDQNDTIQPEKGLGKRRKVGGGQGCGNRLRSFFKHV